MLRIELVEKVDELIPLHLPLPGTPGPCDGDGLFRQHLENVNRPSRVLFFDCLICLSEKLSYPASLGHG